MADFYQNGSITTLHNLGERSTASLEQDLVQHAERRPLGLILPSLYSEIATPALPNILAELKKVPYLSQIVVGLDRANAEEYRHALSFFPTFRNTIECFGKTGRVFRPSMLVWPRRVLRLRSWGRAEMCGIAWAMSWQRPGLTQ